MKQNKILIILSLLLLLSLPLASAGLLGDVWAWLFGEGVEPENLTITRGFDYDIICDGSECTSRIFSTIKYVPNSSGQMQDVEKILSLKDTNYFFATYKKQDSRYEIKITDFNYTSITAEFGVPSDYVGELDIPIKTNEIEKKRTSFIDKNEKKTFDIGIEDFNNFTLKYGFASSEIIINSTIQPSWNDTKCDDDGSSACNSAQSVMVVQKGGATHTFSLISFYLNLSTYSEMEITKAELTVRTNDGSTSDMLTDIYRVDDDWDEQVTTTATNSYDDSVIYNTSILRDTVEGLAIFEIKDLFQAWVNGSFINQGLRLNYSASASAGDTQFSSEQEAVSGLRPYIAVTFDTTTSTTSTTSTSVPFKSQIELTLNGPNENVTINQNEFVNISGRLIIPEPSPTDFIWLLIDGILITNSTSPVFNVTFPFILAGSRNVTLVYPGNLTYHSNGTQLFVDVVDSTLPIITMDTPIQDNLYTTTDQDINFTITELDANWTYYSLDNGTNNITITQNTTVTFPFGTNNLFLFHRDNSSNEDFAFTSFDILGFNSLNFTKDLGIDTNIDYLEFQRANFSLNVTQGTTNPSARLIFNNIAFNPDLTDIDNNQTYFSKLLALPEKIGTSLLNDTFKFHWNITWNGSLETNTSTEQITIWQRFLGSCGLTNTTSVNYTIQDEETGSEIINANYSMIFETLDNNDGIINSFNLSFTNSNSGQICISPEWANFTANVLIEYSSNSFDRRRYDLAKQIFDNSSRSVILNLLTEATSTEVTVNVRDQDDNNLEGYTIEFFRFIVSENNHRLVETGISDFEGKALFRLDKEPTYRAIISLNGVEVIRKDNIKIIGTNPELFFIIPILEESALSSITKLDNLTTSLLFNKTGIDNIVNLSFQDPDDLFGDVCLRIENFTIQDQTVITDSCSNSDDSSISFNMTNFFGSKYLASSYAFTKKSGTRLSIAQLEIDLRGKERLKFYGEDALIDDKVFFTLAIVGTMGGIGLSTGNTAITIIMSIFGLLIAFWLQLTAFSSVAIISVVVMGLFLLYMVKA